MKFFTFKTFLLENARLKRKKRKKEMNQRNNILQEIQLRNSFPCTVFFLQIDDLKKQKMN